MTGGIRRLQRSVLGLFGNLEMIVFNGAAPSIPVALAQAREEAHLWSLAGAKGLPLDTASAVVS